nr:hypothetical protein [Tanacetum cinerariifolium]
MSRTMPPIPPPPGPNPSNAGNPNTVDTMPTNNYTINNTAINNVAPIVVDENIPQLLNSKGGLSTSENPLPKCQNQWSNAESRLANQDKRLKSIIIYCLPNDVMKSVIKCKIAKEMWNDIILAHEGSSDTRDTKDNDSDVEEHQRTSNEFMVDLNVEYHERALLANQKRFYKRSGRFGSARKLIDKSKETCFTYGKLDYKRKYKGLKAEMAVLTKRIDDLTKGKSEKGKNEKGKNEKVLIAESFNWDEESVSSEGEKTTMIRAFMAITKDEPSVAKADERSGQLVDITMKKVHRLLSLTNGNERKHVLDFTHVDLYYVDDQRKNLVNKFNLLKQELSLHKFELCNLKHTLSINCSLQNEVTRANLENEYMKDEMYDLKRGKRKEKISSKEVIFTKANESSSMSIPDITPDFESECETQEPLPPLPKLIGAAPAGTSYSLISLSDLTLNKADLTLNTSVLKKTKPTSVIVLPAHVIKRKTENKSPVVFESCSDKKADAFAEKLLLTLVEEVKGLKKQIEIPSGTAKDLGNIKRKEMEETYHVTFSEDDEAISQTSTEDDAINFNENRSLPDYEFLEPRNKVTQCFANIKYFPCIPSYESITENNFTPTNSIPQDSVSPKEPPEFTSADDHPALNEHNHLESAVDIEPTKIQDFVINEPISAVQPLPTIISPSANVLL